MVNSRRRFIKTIAGTAAYFSIAGVGIGALAKNDFVRITILHTNDVHSHIDPFPDSDPKYAGLGGVARRAAVIKKIRSQVQNVLLFDSGDIFQGSPYFNMYGGELEFKLMSEMGYDAATIGNHEFDNGLKGLEKQLPHANFPFINSNYDFSGTIMNGKTISYKIFIKDGIKIGVFGLGIELEGLVGKKEYGNTIYTDPQQKAAEMAYLLKKEKKCDMVICLSHLGYRYDSDKISDHILAKKSKNIDLIIGGHTHTFIDKPFRYRNSDDEEIIICQVGWAGIKLGRIDYYFEKKSTKKIVESHTIIISNNTSRI